MIAMYAWRPDFEQTLPLELAPFSESQERASGNHVSGWVLGGWGIKKINQDQKVKTSGIKRKSYKHQTDTKIADCACLNTVTGTIRRTKKNDKDQEDVNL